MDYAKIARELKIAKEAALASRDSQRDGEPHPAEPACGMIRPTRECPRCGSRQWVRLDTTESWMCYECPKPDGSKISPNDVAKWHTIPLKSLSLESSDEKPVAGSGLRVTVSARDPELPAVPTEPCPKCGGRQFWRGAAGSFICYKCVRPGDYPKNLSVDEWWYLAPDSE
jgi:ribosomal protein L37AE/L43A